MSRKRFLAIVDPWEDPWETSKISINVENFPMLKSDNNIQYQLIHNQLSRLKPLFDDIIVISSRITTHPMFDELPIVGDIIETGYLEDKQDWDMWLCGFHYGRCIQGKIDDVAERYKWNYNRFHIIQNLSFMFPGDIRKDDMGPDDSIYWDYRDSFYNKFYAKIEL